ncbi:hypothetical protein BDZ91DRAFT_764527 [Kalaharituber pfeilii]|nr:hypothetical protein BDZ91DRAFT_764527 [Kalaharituber pfeilii]
MPLRQLRWLQRFGGWRSLVARGIRRDEGSGILGCRCSKITMKVRLRCSCFGIEDGTAEIETAGLGGTGLSDGRRYHETSDGAEGAAVGDGGGGEGGGGRQAAAGTGASLCGRRRAVAISVYHNSMAMGGGGGGGSEAGQASRRRQAGIRASCASPPRPAWMRCTWCCPPPAARRPPPLPGSGLERGSGNSEAAPGRLLLLLHCPPPSTRARRGRCRWAVVPAAAAGLRPPPSKRAPHPPIEAPPALLLPGRLPLCSLSPSPLPSFLPYSLVATAHDKTAACRYRSDSHSPTPRPPLSSFHPVALFRH